MTMTDEPIDRVIRIRVRKNDPVVAAFEAAQPPRGLSNAMRLLIHEWVNANGCVDVMETLLVRAAAAGKVTPQPEIATAPEPVSEPVSEPVPQALPVPQPPAEPLVPEPASAAPAPTSAPASTPPPAFSFGGEQPARGAQPFTPNPSASPDDIFLGK